MKISPGLTQATRTCLDNRIKIMMVIRQPTLVTERLCPSLYQVAAGVGLPVMEQVRVKLLDDLTTIFAGGISFIIRMNSDPP